MILGSLGSLAGLASGSLAGLADAGLPGHQLCHLVIVKMPTNANAQVKELIREMTEIYNDESATIQERQAAMETIYDLAFPNLSKAEK